MPIGLPIKLVLYDQATNEARRTYLCSFISWKLFKAASRLATTMNQKGWSNLLEEERNAIASLVLEVFARQFTYEELTQGSSLGEMRSVIQEVLNKLRSRGKKKVDKKDAQVDEVAASPEKPDPDDDWMANLEITLVTNFNWNLRDIDEMDINTLKSFMDLLAGKVSNPITVGEETGRPVRRVKCDQASFLL